MDDSLRLGVDSMLLIFSQDFEDFSALKKEMTKLENGSMRVQRLSITVTEGEPLGPYLNQTFRTILNSAWQWFPMVLVVIVKGRVSFDYRSIIYSRLSTLAKICLLSFKRIMTLGDLRATTQNLPESPLDMSDSQRKVLISNLLRAKVVTLLAEQVKSEGGKGYVDLIGWNELEVMMCLNQGLYPAIFDKYEHSYTHPLLETRRTDVQIVHRGATGYIPPSTSKLNFLHAYMWKCVTANLIYVGAYPGNLLLNAKLSVVRSRCTSAFNPNPRFILFDPKFGDPQVRRHAEALRINGFEVFTRRFQYWEGSTLIKEFDDKNLTICDDAYDPKVNKDEFLRQKLKFYAHLIFERRYAKTTVILKFQFPKETRSFNIPYYHDILFQPGVNDSTETRLVLSSDGHFGDGPRTLYATDYALSINAWRDLSLKEQYDRTIVYFRDLILKTNYLTQRDSRDRDLIISYAMTSSVSNKAMALGRWKHVIRELVNHRLDDRRNVLVILPRDVIGTENKMTTFTHNSRVYSDWMISEGEIWDFPLFSITPLGLVRDGGLSYESEIYDMVSLLRGRRNFADMPYVLIGGGVVDRYLPQTIYGSPGPLIKCFTLSYRISQLKTQVFTYHKRLQFLRQISNLDRLDGDSTLDNSTSYLSNADQTLMIHDGPLVGEHIKLSRGEKVDLSGHLLNLMIARHFSFDLLKLWLEQWKLQSKIRDMSSHSPERKRLQLAYENNELIDYNPDSPEGLLNPWHSKNDLLCALAISEKYLRLFGVAYDDERDTMRIYNYIRG